MIKKVLTIAGQTTKMRKNIVWISLISLMISINSMCFAMNWKLLHEQADTMTLKQAEKRVHDYPDSLEYLYVLGLNYLNNYRNDGAKEIFNKILTISPDSYEAQWGLAELLRRKHKLNESEGELENIIKEYPDFYPAYLS
ncbi:MAG: tetratricopeptide repeat protein [Candidatus Omnitrophica bacterium]|nr:tetratricopeptide repeat protein [Candidatus Omnitrophota bacterium]